MFKSTIKFIVKVAIAAGMSCIFFRLAFVHSCASCGAATFDTWKVQNDKGQLVNVCQECYHEMRELDN